MKRIEAALAEQPDAPDLLVEYGALLFEPFHEAKASRTALERALAQRPEDVQALFWLAKLAVHWDLDDEMARVFLERALAVNPKQPECLALMISVLRQNRQESWRCAGLAAQLVAAVPDWPRAHELSAEVASMEGRVSEAHAEYAEALRLAEELRKSNLPQSYFEEAITGRYATDDSIARLREALAAASPGAGRK